MAADPTTKMRSAHWCFQALKSCKDPQLAAELQFLAQSLLRQARAKLAEARAVRNAARKALTTVSQAA